MKIKVRYTAQLKKAMGRREEFVEIPNGTLIVNLLGVLLQQNKEAFTDIVFDDNGDFLNAVLLILNGQQTSIDSIQSLNENDVITIMSPIAGG